MLLLLAYNEYKNMSGMIQRGIEFKDKNFFRQKLHYLFFTSSIDFFHIKYFLQIYLKNFVTLNFVWNKVRNKNLNLEDWVVKGFQLKVFASFLNILFTYEIYFKYDTWWHVIFYTRLEIKIYNYQKKIIRHKCIAFKYLF